LGKFFPYFALSLLQGLFLILAGKLIFGLRWGPGDWSILHQVAWLLPVVFCTSLAAMGMALLVATLARSEIQVAIAGTLLVLILALVSGCLVPRGLMQDNVKTMTLATPHAWALEAYTQLLV
jgi:ABC-type multidrug transport system permease subunit